MQKKIIALAVAAALTAPAMAFAEATVYGKANMSYDRVNDGAVANASTMNVLTSNNSRIGFKGSEDLGGGLSTVWQMEAAIGVDDGTNKAGNFFSRNTFVGLKSKDMGTLVAGVHDTPYKSSTRKLDMFGDQIVSDNRKPLGVNMMGGGTHEARNNNSLTYTSPDFSGLKIAAQAVFGGETAGSGAAKGSFNTLAGMYSADALYATLAYSQKKLGDTGTGDLAGTTGGTSGDKYTGTKVGVGYKMDAISLSGIFESLKFDDNSANVSTKNTNLYLGAKFAMSNTDAVKLAYTIKGESETGSVKNKDKGTSLSIGYDHGLSKSTAVYISYTKVTCDTGLNADKDPSAISLGMVTSF